MPTLSSHIPKAAQWHAASRGKANDAQATRTEIILRAYHIKTGTAVEERTELLQELLAIAKDYIEKHTFSAAYYTQFIELGMQVQKQLIAMEKAKKAWGSAKKIFAPSGSQFGKTNPLQNYSAKAASPTSARNYWLEGLDPNHRSWGHMPKAHFDNWLADAGTTLGFFEWLEDKNLARGLPQVEYLAPNERWKYMCVFGDDKIMYRHQQALGSPGTGSIPLQRFTTWGLQTAHSGRNYAIWVCGANGIFYTNSHAVSKFHHSSFLAGQRVLAAGEWVITAGKLLLISHKTGHHAASVSNLYSAIRLLDSRLDLSRTVVQITDYVAKKNRFITAKQFLAKGGNAAACDEILTNTGMPMNMKLEAQKRCDMHKDWDFKHATTPKRFTTA